MNKKKNKNLILTQEDEKLKLIKIIELGNTLKDEKELKEIKKQIYKNKDDFITTVRVIAYEPYNYYMLAEVVTYKGEQVGLHVISDLYFDYDSLVSNVREQLHALRRDILVADSSGLLSNITR